MNLFATLPLSFAPKNLSPFRSLFPVRKANKIGTQFSAWQWAGEGLDLTRPRLP